MSTINTIDMAHYAPIKVKPAREGAGVAGVGHGVGI